MGDHRPEYVFDDYAKRRLLVANDEQLLTSADYTLQTARNVYTHSDEGGRMTQEDRMIDLRDALLKEAANFTERIELSGSRRSEPVLDILQTANNVVNVSEEARDSNVVGNGHVVVRRNASNLWELRLQMSSHPSICHLRRVPRWIGYRRLCKRRKKISVERSGFPVT